jgi:phosphatidylglycerol lysyltransferase
LRFLVHPLESEFPEGSRHFYAYFDGKAIGFIFFDPIFKNGEIISYIPNVSRASNNFRQGIYYVIMNHAMELFKTEGLSYIELGLAPLMVGDEIEPQESKYVKFIAKLIYKNGNRLYNFKGLEFSKSRFQGRVEKSYYCNRNKLPIFSIFALFRMSGII